MWKHAFDADPQFIRNSLSIPAAGIHAVHLPLFHVLQDLLTEQVRGAVRGGTGQDVAQLLGLLDLLNGFHHSDRFACT